MPSEKPTAFLQIDVDGLWAVRRCYARSEGDAYHNDPVWSEGIPLSLDLFEHHNLRASYFLVGRDLLLDHKVEIARSLVAAGHEVANHSFSHRLGLTLLPVGAIAREILRTEKIMERVGLPAPRGFRAPGYDIDSRVLRTVRRLGYAYDASILPTPWSPVMRLADAWLAGQWQSSKRQFGRIAYARAPRAPYHPDPNRIRKSARISDATFTEIPVGILPFWQLPLTAATIFALGPRRVIKGLRTLARRNQSTLVLLHGIDFVDCTKPLVFANTTSPAGFNLSVIDKMKRIEPVLQCLAEEFNVVRADHWTQAQNPISNHTDSV
jgi:hypothetical protein